MKTDTTTPSVKPAVTYLVEVRKHLGDEWQKHRTGRRITRLTDYGSAQRLALKIRDMGAHARVITVPPSTQPAQ